MFSNDEIQLLDSGYFIVHEASCGCIVLESRCTGHFWAITGTGTGSVSLKHKHREKDEWHPQAFYIKGKHDLNGAIAAIKAHDTYVLEGRMGCADHSG